MAALCLRLRQIWGGGDVIECASLWHCKEDIKLLNGVIGFSDNYVPK